MGQVQPRLVVALLLVAGGIVWAAVRGLHWYGAAPVNLVYSVDQPPILVALVGIWLCYRSRAG